VDRAGNGVSGAVTVYVGIGSNIEPERHVAQALDALARRFGPLRRSGVYRTRAVGFDGDDFLNLVVAFDTSEPPSAVAAVLREIEDAAGRRRGGERFAPRTLDLDLLLYGERVIRADGLEVPRRDILDQAFVLGPLAELAPGVRHPELGLSFAELWSRFQGPREMELVEPGSWSAASQGS